MEDLNLLLFVAVTAKSFQNYRGRQWCRMKVK